MAAKNLLKRKMRTFLTVLGVVIGVVSIVLMISLGVGINMNFDKQMEGMGDLTVIEIYNYSGYIGEAGATPFDDALIDTLSKLPGVEIVTPSVEISGVKLISGRYSTNVNILGVRPEALTKLGYEIAEGDTLSADSKENEIVFGVEPPYDFMTASDRKRQQANMSRGFYGGGRAMMFSADGSEAEEERDPPKIDVLTARITGSYWYSYGEKDAEYPNNKKPDVYKFKGVGTLKKNETKYQASYYCFMDFEKVMKLQKDMQKYNEAAYNYRGNTQKTYGYEQGYVKCKSLYDVQAVSAELDKYEKLNYYNPMSWINEMKKTAASLQILLSAIGGVAFFVAAIGIANTMIMSMHERVKEIGVMKVIGAKLNDIRNLFLLEAAMIGIIGGIFGLGLCYLSSAVLNNVGISFLNNIASSPTGEKSVVSYIPMWLSASALIFSAGIGLIAGYFPARRAMKVSALTAIKSE
jgi:ABC-type antimicrobial peptide transport system permease subunit